MPPPTPTTDRRTSVSRRQDIPLWMLFPLFFVAVFLSHLTLLRLPYFWDEAGYYIPAAWDLFRTGTLIPQSTVTNAHPPLPSILLAAWWHLSGFVVTGTRTLICMVSGSALLAVYRIGRNLAGTPAAIVATLLTAIYPIWFAQSTLAHADIFAAAFTLWAISFYLDPKSIRRPNRQSLPHPTLDRNSLLPRRSLQRDRHCHPARPRRLGSLPIHPQPPPPPPARTHRNWAITLIIPILPLIAWYAYHYSRTGYVFGNPEYLRYNATANLSAYRILLGLWHRLLHLTTHMNMFVPTLCTIAALLIPTKKPGIPRPTLNAIAVILIANWIAYSILGGALLTRYLLPLYPLILLYDVAAWQRHFKKWLLPAALTAAAFLAGIWINPPYAFAPEDNLTYRDMIVLHQQAVRILTTALPASHRPHRMARHLRAHPPRDRLHPPPRQSLPHPELLPRPDAASRRRTRRLRHRLHLLHQVGTLQRPPQPRQTKRIRRHKILRLPPRPNPRRSRRTPPRRNHLASPPPRRMGRHPPLPPHSKRQPHTLGLKGTCGCLCLLCVLAHLCALCVRRHSPSLKPQRTIIATMKRSQLGRFFSSIFAVCIALTTLIASAQTPDPTPPGRLILVLPFENKSGNPALAWIADSFPDTLNQRLNSAGFLTITRDDRQFALDHLGLPVDFKPSRATTIRIAQTLDANYIIVGSYNVDAPAPELPNASPSRPRSSKSIVCACPHPSKTRPRSLAYSTSRTPSPGRSPVRSIPSSM